MADDRNETRNPRVLYVAGALLVAWNLYLGFELNSLRDSLENTNDLARRAMSRAQAAADAAAEARQ
jgi:hypothetical protein